MLAALVIVDVALINPPVKILPPVILPVALTRPAVVKLPPEALPLTVSAVNVPTCVIADWMLLVTVPAVPAEVAAPARVAVITLAAKLPLASRLTTVLLTRLGVASTEIVIAPVGWLTER